MRILTAFFLCFLPEKIISRQIEIKILFNTSIMGIHLWKFPSKMYYLICLHLEIEVICIWEIFGRRLQEEKLNTSNFDAKTNCQITKYFPQLFYKLLKPLSQTFHPKNMTFNRLWKIFQTYRKLYPLTMNKKLMNVSHLFTHNIPPKKHMKKVFQFSLPLTVPMIYLPKQKGLYT